MSNLLSISKEVSEKELKNLIEECTLNETFELIKSGNSKIIKAISNEKLIDLIQAGYDEAWEVLYNKTKKSIHKVFHEHVHGYYKNTMDEDIYSILYFGWTKAVLTYNREKATANFVAYASYLMQQQYIMFVRKIKPDRIGKSVRYELLDSVIAEDPKRNTSVRQKDSLIQNILEDKKDIYGIKENKILLKEALLALKNEKEDLHELIVLHYLEGIPQTKIAEMYNHGQSYISRKIKQAIKFLQDYVMIKSKGNTEGLKENVLSAFNI
jgi:RNA polymerase sigma factor (sigma-70 family)